MKTIVALAIALAICGSAGAQPTLTGTYADAAVKVLDEWNDSQFHALRLAADKAKTSVDKRSLDALHRFLLLHRFTYSVSQSGLDTQKNEDLLRKDSECRDQWETNLKYRDPSVPDACGIK